MKLNLWAVLFWVCYGIHSAIMFVACWTDWAQARCAFRSIGNKTFCNPRHNFARFETIRK